MYYSVVWRAQRDERFACPCSRAIPHYLVFRGRLCCILVSSPPFFIIKNWFTIYYSVIWRAQRDKRCVCPCSRYISYYLVLGGFCCISVSSPPFFIIQGSFTMYSNVVWRAQRDERFTCPHSGAIPHYLVLGGRLCCISVSSPPFFIIEGLFTMYSDVVWRGQRDERFVCPHSGAIPHYLVLEGLCCISVSSPPFFYHWRLVFNVFKCRLKELKRRVVRVTAFSKYSTLSGFGGGVMLYLGKFSTVFYHRRLIYSPIQKA